MMNINNTNNNAKQISSSLLFKIMIIIVLNQHQHGRHQSANWEPGISGLLTRSGSWCLRVELLDRQHVVTHVAGGGPQEHEIQTRIKHQRAYKP